MSLPTVTLDLSSNVEYYGKTFKRWNIYLPNWQSKQSITSSCLTNSQVSPCTIYIDLQLATVILSDPFSRVKTIQQKISVIFILLQLQIIYFIIMCDKACILAVYMPTTLPAVHLLVQCGWSNLANCTNSLKSAQWKFLGCYTTYAKILHYFICSMIKTALWILETQPLAHGPK